MAAYFKPAFTLKGLRGVENVAVAVKESCVLDVNSGTLLIISSGRVLTCIFNCSSKARYLSCNLKYRLAFSSSRRAFQESHLFSIPPYNS